MAEKAEMTPSDAAYLLDALRSVTNPVIINVGEIAAQKNAKVNTVQKRLSDIKKRYNLNIHTTAASGAGPATPIKPKPTRIAKTPTLKKTGAKEVNASKAACITERLEEFDRGSVETTVFKSEDGHIMPNTEESEDGIHSNVAEEDSDRV